MVDEAGQPARAAAPSAVRGPGAAIAGVVVLGLLVGANAWAGWRDMGARRAEHTRAQMLDAGREAALALTTIDHGEVDADVQRILDATTGAFRDDFARNADSFKTAARQAQSTSVGTVREAGVESVDGDSGRVLVALTVMTSNRGVPAQNPKSWRTRVTVAKTGDGFRVTAVEFLQ